MENNEQEMWDVTVTYNGQTGDYNKVPAITSPEELKSWLWESIQNGEIQGVTAGSEDLRDYHVQPLHSRKLFVVRPSVKFGNCV